MAGINYKVCSKVLFDFSQVSASQYMEIVAAKGVPVFAYREATLLVRYHSGTITTGQSIDVRARGESPADDDPNADFVYSADLATATVGSSTTAPALIIASLGTGFGSYLRIVVRGTQPGGASTLKGYLSIDLSLKASA